MYYFNDPTFTPYDLINNFEITFVTGAIYKDVDGNFFECCNTGKYINADCFTLDENKNRIANEIYPKQESDLVEFICFRDEI